LGTRGFRISWCLFGLIIFPHFHYKAIKFDPACSHKRLMGGFPGTVGPNALNPVIVTYWYAWSPSHWRITKFLQEVSIFTGVCYLPFGRMVRVGDGSAMSLVLWQTVIITLVGLVCSDMGNPPVDGKHDRGVGTKHALEEACIHADHASGNVDVTGGIQQNLRGLLDITVRESFAFRCF
jgi:hypothetical protein